MDKVPFFRVSVDKVRFSRFLWTRFFMACLTALAYIACYNCEKRRFLPENKKKFPDLWIAIQRFVIHIHDLAHLVD